MAASSSAVTPWYLSGGAPTPLAVWNGKGAASQAASYINLVNPGTLDLVPGVAPTWATGTGWTLNGTTQYLRTGVVGSSAVSFLFRFSNCTGTLATMGAAQTSPDRYTFIRPRTTTNRQIYLSATDSFTKAGALTSGVFGWAAHTVYLDGANDGTVSGAPVDSPAAIEMFLGALNLNGSPSQYSAMNLLAAAVWDTSTGHATWMPAVSAAVATL